VVANAARALLYSQSTDHGRDVRRRRQRFAVAPGLEPSTVKQDKVVFIFNFFDELRRIAPSR